MAKKQDQHFEEKGGFEVDISMKKESIADPFSEVPPAEEMKVFLQQHVGPEAKLIVEKDEFVEYGERIAGKKEQHEMMVPVHSPVSGLVKDIKKIRYPLTGEKKRAVVINTESEEKQNCYEPLDPAKSSRDILLQRVKEAGVVGLGGAAFPTHIKLSEDDISHLLINAKESDPNLASDVRLMMEKPEKLIQGILLMGKILDVDKITFATRTQKDTTPDFEELLRENEIEIQRVRPNYSVGSEKLLVKEVLDMEVPSGEFPPSVNTVVHNVATAYAVAEAVLEGLPLVSRGMTFYSKRTGGKNLWTRMGTPIEHILKYEDTSPSEFKRVALGSIMMGPTVPDPSHPILKATSGLTAFTRNEKDPYEEQKPCIRCGYCNLVCPVDIYPQQIMMAEKRGDEKMLEKLNVLDCIDCALCSYVCPSNIRLTPYLRRGQSKVAKPKE